jgi:hypothetical protein
MLLSLLERLALRRRRPGSHPAWSAVAFAAFLLRQHRKRANRDAVVLREELSPGETLVITHTSQRQG